ncbi:MAG: pyridoxal-phosphate dependent enzyme [Trueperaceae bacterium]|nr:pyridoxal-phosphate dependent enzyme [Trueperaceae bacterium]
MTLAAKLTDLKSRLAALPRARFAHLPTPLDHCLNLGADLVGIDLWVKRDDATGMALGGNKTRQLEFMLGHALSEGCDCIIQGAASQSNHSRQLAAAGARLGLEVHLTPWLDARSRPVQGNFLLSHLYGAKLHPIPLGASSIEAKTQLAERLRAEGRKPYIVGMGAHEALVLAAVAYVDAFVEILGQLGEDRLPDWIFATSQGSTQAGLLAAARILGLDVTIVGINPLGPDHEAYSPPAVIERMVLDAAERLGYQIELEPGDVINRTDFVGESYGIPSRAGLAALRRLAEREGILLDPVYSSKGFSGVIGAVESGEVAPGDRVVFVHTGGLPIVFPYAEEILASYGGEDEPRE